MNLLCASCEWHMGMLPMWNVTESVTLRDCLTVHSSQKDLITKTLVIMRGILLILGWRSVKKAMDAAFVLIINLLKWMIFLVYKKIFKLHVENTIVLYNSNSIYSLDGLPPELYLEIWDLVGILMLNSFNFAIEHGVFHRDQKTSLISLLLKKGKDPLDCSSYRPISLIPCDLKIYAKVFASRMEKVIHSLIKEDQTGLITGLWQYASTPSYSWLCGLPPNPLCGLFT